MKNKIRDKKNCFTLRRSEWYWLIPLLFSPLFDLPAYADDPISVCKIDHPYDWYFSIGTDVFHIPDALYPPQTDNPLIGNIDKNQEVPPPDKNSPVGCKDNPQQLRKFIILNWPQLQPENYAGGMPKDIYELHLYYYKVPNNSNQTFDPELDSLQLSLISCQNKKFITMSLDGTYLCASAIGQLNPYLRGNSVDFFSLSWEFIISGNKYHTPLGQNLVSEYLLGAETTYLLTPNILVDYEWLIPRNAQHIDPEYIVDLDKVFLQKMDSYRIKNYSWKDKNINRN